MNKFKSYAPNFLRIGISLVIMWFGFQQLIHPEQWINFLPEFVDSMPFSNITFVYLNGWFEVFAGLLMVLGLFTRIASILIIIHLVGIVFTLGYNAIAIRDIGLIFALISISLHGPDSWSIDSEKESDNNEII
jgi:uncharacterized membrane protein YphA (DoxX/SURF4 family)